MTTLPRTLESALQMRGWVKSFFVDGGSDDGTVDYLRAYSQIVDDSVLLLQSGRGLYQALNQGIQVALEDPDITHIGMLHSDDVLLPESFRRYAEFIRRKDAEVFYSDIEFHDYRGKTTRVWESGEFSEFKLITGWMPPHTSVVVSKKVYQKVGLYDPNFGTAADYEWIVRVFSKYGEDSRYFSKRTLSMRVGGASSSGLKARLRANAMDGRVWADRSKFHAIIIRFCKPLRKFGQFLVTKEG